MSFIINQNFDLKSAQWNFERDYFKDVASLKAAPETNFPDHFITNVAGVLYQLTKSNSVDTTTGKWRKVKLGSDVDLSDYVKSTTLTTELTKYAKLDGSTAFTGIITAKGFKLPNGNSGNLLAADGSLMNLANLVKRSYSATDATDFSIDWIRQFSGYTTSDSFVNNTTGFGIVRELRGGKSEVLIDSTGAINIASDNIKIYNKSGIDPTNALTFDGSNFSIKSDNGTSAQYYAADGSIQTLEKLSDTEIDSVFA